MLLITMISDTHTLLSKVTLPEGDILIHAGDLCGIGDIKEMAKELKVLANKGKDYESIILVPGNHDSLSETNPSLMEDMCSDLGIIYLHDETKTVSGIKMYGSGWTPAFNNWFLNLPRGEALAYVWSKIPEDTELLVTHGPPYGILDHVTEYDAHTGTNYNRYLGCEDLANRIKDLKQLKLMVFGHVHYSAGIQVIGSTTFVNASICTESYKPTNSPIQINFR